MREAKGWFAGFAPVRKGGPGSGNYGHKGIPGHRGGSLPGGGHAVLGLAPEAGQAEKQKIIEQHRERRDVDRVPTSEEQALEGEIQEVQDYLQTVTDDTERQALLEYAGAARDQLHQTQAINDALWQSTSRTPDEATEEDWRQTVDDLQTEGYRLYQQYDKEGIELKIQEERGAQAGARQELVGGQWVTVQEGRFSRKEADHILSERWADAKEEVSKALGQQLRWAGFSSREITGADLFQRIRLLQEIGDMKLATRSRGRPRAIDGVPLEARKRIVSTVSHDMASTAGHVAVAPLEAPGLGAYSKMSLADLIRRRYLRETEQGGEIAPLGF